MPTGVVAVGENVKVGVSTVIQLSPVTVINASDNGQYKSVYDSSFSPSSNLLVAVQLTDSPCLTEAGMSSSTCQRNEVQSSVTVIVKSVFRSIKPAFDCKIVYLYSPGILGVKVISVPAATIHSSPTTVINASDNGQYKSVYDSSFSSSSNLLVTIQLTDSPYLTEAGMSSTTCQRNEVQSSVTVIVKSVFLSTKPAFDCKTV